MLHLILGELHILMEAGAVFTTVSQARDLWALYSSGCTPCLLAAGKVGLVLLCTSLWKVNRLIFEPWENWSCDLIVISFQKVLHGFSRGQSGLGGWFAPVLNISKYIGVMLP